MISYKRGDVVLVDFGYAEGTGTKKRPTLVISTGEYHRSRQDVIVLAITSDIGRILYGDTRIQKWKEAGLLYPSVVTAIIRTIKMTGIIRKLGALSRQDFHEVETGLAKALGLARA